MMGVGDDSWVFHVNPDCENIDDAVFALPESKALKWDYDLCKNCMDVSSP